MMNTWGANCVPSPSKDTNAGRKILEANPDSPGSLGIAISEAIEDAVTSKDTRYSLGSVLNHVLMHQTIIGLEAKKQLEKIRGEESRYRHRVCRRGKQLCRPCLSLCPGQDQRRQYHHYPCGAHFLPHHDPGAVCL